LAELAHTFPQACGVPVYEAAPGAEMVQSVSESVADPEVGAPGNRISTEEIGRAHV